ncbi:MAG: glycosyltransferase [Cyclobacteriaceae bacterium]|nr:glycosyltransferase [Cyclobacteriaceae bacterium]
MVLWLSIFVFYFIFMLLLAGGLLRWRKSKNPANHTLAVSVVVAMRNEALNLQTLVGSLAQQNYACPWQLLLVDDHSEDNTIQVAQILKHQYSNLDVSILQSPGDGKKQALATGIENATGEIILTTDADCELPVDWITDMVNSFGKSTQLVAGAVRLKATATFFGKMQAVEFTSVMAAGLGMLGWGKPVMCNGASLAFRKSAFAAVGGYAGNEQVASGDDEFLMRKIAGKFPGSIRAVRYGNNTCTTKPAATISEFYDQRIRWAGKWSVNSSGLARFVGVFVFLFQVTWLPVVAIALFTQSPLLLAGVVLKILLEFVVLALAARFIHQQFYLPAFLVLQILYPPYVILVALSSQILGYRWKGRSFLPPR